MVEDFSILPAVNEALTGNPDRVKALFTTFVSNSEMFTTILLLDPKGTTVAGQNKTGEPLATSYAEREYFQAIAAGQDSHITKSIFRGKSTGVLMFAVSKAVRGPDGKLLGVLVGYPAWEAFTKRFIDPLEIRQNGLRLHHQRTGPDHRPRRQQEPHPQSRCGQVHQQQGPGAQKRLGALHLRRRGQVHGRGPGSGHGLDRVHGRHRSRDERRGRAPAHHTPRAGGGGPGGRSGRSSPFSTARWYCGPWPPSAPSPKKSPPATSRPGSSATSASSSPPWPTTSVAWWRNSKTSLAFSEGVLRGIPAPLRHSRPQPHHDLGQWGRLAPSWNGRAPPRTRRASPPGSSSLATRTTPRCPIRPSTKKKSATPFSNMSPPRARRSTSTSRPRRFSISTAPCSVPSPSGRT